MANPRQEQIPSKGGGRDIKWGGQEYNAIVRMFKIPSDAMSTLIDNIC